MQLNLPNEIEFAYKHYHHVLVEPGQMPYDWVLTERLKTWLDLNAMQIFVDLNCGDTGTDSPLVTFRFRTTADALKFYDYWCQKKN